MSSLSPIDAVAFQKVSTGDLWRNFCNLVYRSWLSEVQAAGIKGAELDNLVKAAQFTIYDYRDKGVKAIGTSGSMLGLTKAPNNFWAALVSATKGLKAPKTSAAVQQAAAWFWNNIEKPAKAEATGGRPVSEPTPKKFEPSPASAPPGQVPAPVEPEGPEAEGRDWSKIAMVGIPAVLFVGVAAYMVFGGKGSPRPVAA